MSETVGFNYATLPLPDLNEFTKLQSEPFSIESRGGLTPDHFAMELIGSDRYLAQAIVGDIAYWREKVAPTVYNHGPSEDEYATGITEGYAFLIGLVEAVKFMRSGCDTLDEYMQKAKAIGELPILGERELDRVNEVREGKIEKAFIDSKFREDIVDDSTNLAHYDSAKYVFNSPIMQNLLAAQIKSIKVLFGLDQDDAKDLMRAHVAGFKHGVTNAVEMFIQAAEERTIMGIEYLYPFDLLDPLE